MKIIFIGGRDITLLGGIENYMYHLTGRLTSLGYECVVYCESNRHCEENIDGVRVIRWKSLPSNLLTKPVLSLCSTIHALIHHSDAVYIHYNTWTSSLFAWLPWLFRKKVILQGHGFEWKRTKYSPIARKIHHMMEFITAWIVPHLTMVSEEQSEYFRTHYHRHPRTIPCAVDEQPLIDEKTASEILSRYGLEKNKYFLFLGRLINEKNPDKLIEAYKKYARNSGLSLALAGNLDNTSAFDKRLRKLAEGESGIIFTGAVYGDVKQTLLQNCACFCLPSTLEGLPIALLEAMDAGCPIICSEIPACREAVSENALFAPPEDVEALGTAMQSVINNEVSFEKFRLNNKDRIRQYFTWETVTAQYIDFLKSC
jgi:glycosyltransferase involved in cell wall biosynthesis